MRKMLKWVLVLVGALCAGSVRATPPSGFAGTTLALGRFGDIDVKLRAFLPESARPGEHGGRRRLLVLDPEEREETPICTSRTTSGRRAGPPAGTVTRGTA